MDTKLLLELLAAAGTSLGLAMLIGHEIWSRVLTVLGTVLFGVVLIALLVLA